jgi:nucleotide-binding universal stress UspA family protein
MPQEKDYLGEKLHLLERAREDVYFRKLNQELIERLRQEDEAKLEKPPPSSAVFTPILVPVDFSAYSTKALLCAADLAERCNSAIIVLHVISREVSVHAARQRLGVERVPLLGPYTESQARNIPDQELESVIVDHREQAYTQLQSFLPERLARCPIELRVVIGNPFERIIEMALREKAGLIVLGTHGRTGLAHIAMGSVAERVVRLAPCPVLTVKAPPPETESWLEDFYEKFIPPRP